MRPIAMGFDLRGAQKGAQFQDGCQAGKGDAKVVEKISRPPNALERRRGKEGGLAGIGLGLLVAHQNFTAQQINIT